MFTPRPILIVAAFALTLGAGLAASNLVNRLPGNNPVTAAGPHSPLGDQLHLSPEQSQQMRVIWEGTRDRLDDCLSHGQSLQQQRDDAVIALLTPEQKKQYALISEAYVEKFAELSQHRQMAFDDAIKQTERILNEQQKQKYREIISSRVGHQGSLGVDGKMAAGLTAGQEMPGKLSQ